MKAGKIEAHRIEIEDVSAGLLTVHGIWASAKSKKIAPSLREFGLPNIPYRLLRTSIVVDFLKVPDKFKIRFFGTGLCNIHRVDITGGYLSDLPNKGLAELLTTMYHNVISSKEFDFSEIGYIDFLGFHRMQKSGRWPLSDDGQNVSSILSVIDVAIDARELGEIIGQKKHQNVRY